MPTEIDDLKRRLVSESGHGGLLAFIEQAGQDNLRFEAGKPRCSAHERVKTMVSVLPRYQDSVVMFFSPLDERIAWWKMYRNMMIPASWFKPAGHDVLESIGMAPDRCHPFPDMQYVGEDKPVQGLIMDTKLSKQGTPHCFPVYSTTSDERIGSIYVQPGQYFQAMEELVGDVGKRFASERIINAFDIVDYERLPIADIV